MDGAPSAVRIVATFPVSEARPGASTFAGDSSFRSVVKPVPAWQNARSLGRSQALGPCATISVETSLCRRNQENGLCNRRTLYRH
jgi:hypothetical protein